MSDVRDPERDQVAPIPNDRPSIHDLVAEDMLERKAYGLRKYDSLLQAGNGRNALLDMYEELMDLIVYTRTELEERKEGISFAWDIVDKNPQYAVECLLRSAPMTTVLLQAAALRAVAGQMHNGAEDSQLQEFYDRGVAQWLYNEADRLRELVLATLAEQDVD